MRCYCCQKNLNDYESTARNVETNEFLDMCMKCINESGIAHVGRHDLFPDEEVDEDNSYEYEDE